MGPEAAREELARRGGSAAQDDGGAPPGLTRRGRLSLALLAVAALAAGIAGVRAGSGADDEKAASAPAGAHEAPAPARKPDLARDVGQLLVSTFDETSPPPYIRRRLRGRQSAGVILFTRNAGSAEALRRLTGELQREAHGEALVMTDQEGGPVRTFPFAGPEPAQPAQASPEASGSLARAAARQLRSDGVNVALAPVADVTSGTGSALAGRAFGGDVAAHVAAAVRGWLAGRVAPTAKHFPGLGAAAVNTDDGPVNLPGAPTPADLAPFRAAIAARVPLVMAGHALYPGADRDRIASQSPALLTRLLRERLRFRGVIVTDSIEAEAVLRRSSVAEAAERSVAAGADLVLTTGSASVNLIYPRLLAKARSSAAFRRRVEESAARVRALKRSLGLRTG